MKLPIKKIHYQNFLNGTVVIFVVIAAIIALSYIIMHNPHKSLHQALFATADNIRNFYRDHPSYWNLSTKSAIEDHLVVAELQNHKEFPLLIGQGEDGSISMPNDISFNLILKKVNKSACINLSELPVSKENQLSLQRITILNKNGSTEFTWGNAAHGLPIKRYKTRRLCDADGNTLIWTFQ